MPNPIRRVVSAVAGLWSRWGGQGWGGGPGLTRIVLGGSRFDYRGEAGDLWANSTLAIAVKWLGDRFPKPLVHAARIDRKGNHVPVPNHPAVRLWERPNPHYTRRAIEKAVGLSLLVDGNAFVWKRRSLAGKVVELWWLPHVGNYSVEPTWPEDGSEWLSGWLVTVEGTQVWLPATDVIHFRDGLDPRNERLGLSAVQAQLREVCTDNECSGHTASLLRNAAVPGLAVIPDAEEVRPSKEDAEIIKERFRDSFTGDNRGDTVVLAGRFKVQPVGFSPESLRLDKLPQTAMAKVAAAAGVPLMAMGLPDPGKTYSNVGQAVEIGWGAVAAIQELIAEGLRYGLVAEFDDPDVTTIEYDYSQVRELQEDLDKLHARNREDVKAGIKTQNEAREEIGLDPDPDGDRYYPGTFDAVPGDEEAIGVPSGAGAVVQDTALNGAQIASLLSIVEQVVAGTLPPESAEAMILAAFPNLTPEQIADIIDPAAEFEPDVPEPPPGGVPPGLPAPDGAMPTAPDAGAEGEGEAKPEEGEEDEGKSKAGANGEAGGKALAGYY